MLLGRVKIGIKTDSQRTEVIERRSRPERLGTESWRRGHMCKGPVSGEHDGVALRDTMESLGYGFIDDTTVPLQQLLLLPLLPYSRRLSHLVVPELYVALISSPLSYRK